MSTVKTTNVQHPSSGSANIQLGADGSVVLPAGFTGGLGTNVVGAAASTFSTTSGTFQDVTGASVTITPSSATSKVLVLASAYRLVQPGGVGQQVELDASSGTTGIQIMENYSTARTDNTAAASVLHSPATTSPVTYKLRMRVSFSSGTVTIHEPRITAIEVAA